MALSLNDITLSLGSFVGNRGTAYAAGASAEVYSQLTAVQDTLRLKLYKAGQKIGPVLGTGSIKKMLEGAETTGPAASSALESRYLGYSLPQIALYGGLGLVGLWTLIATLRK